MVYKAHINDGTVIVQLSGSIDTRDSKILRYFLLGYMEKGCNAFRLDMTEADYIDNCGVGVIGGLQKRVIVNGGYFSICGANGLVKEMFEMAKLACEPLDYEREAS